MRTGSRFARTVLLAMAVVSTAQLAAAGVTSPTAEPQGARLTFGTPRDIIEGLGVFQPADVGIGVDGEILVADWGASELVKVSADGELLWRAGAKGEGPGEFQVLTRVAVGPAGEVVAFDAGRQVVSWFDAEGKFLRAIRLPTRMRPLDDILVLPGGRIAVSGVSATIGRYAIRVFDPELNHLSSFGPYPAVEYDRTLYSWGAGAINLTGAGNILYTRRLPHELYEYEPDGEMVRVIKAPYGFEDTPDSSVVETVVDGRAVVSQAPHFVPRPMAAEDLGDGWLLGGVVTDADHRNGTWSLFHEGRLVAEQPVTNGWGHLVGVDRPRRLLYFAGESPDGNVSILQVPFTIEAETPAPSLHTERHSSL